MVNDKVNTANRIVLASGLPVSITIIGVGTTDFTAVCNSVCVCVCVCVCLCCKY